jgi:hypothetical protein
MIDQLLWVVFFSGLILIARDVIIRAQALDEILDDADYPREREDDR